MSKCLKRFEHIHAAIRRLLLKKESACKMEFIYRLEGHLDKKDKNENLPKSHMIRSTTMTPLCYLKSGIT